MKTKCSLSVLLSLALLFCLKVSAQDIQEKQASSSSGKFTDRLITGGNIGMQFGTQTMIDLSPMIGYKITDKFVAGISIKYQYNRFRLYKQYPVVSATSYGGSIFARYYILENVFLHAEYEILNYTPIYEYPPNSGYLIKGNPMWISSPFAGAGYRQAIGQSSSFDIMILYDFNATFDSPYENPVIRAGITLGF